MRLLARVDEAWSRKSFAQPPVWELDAARFVNFAGGTYMAEREKIENDFVGYVTGAFKDDSVVFGLIDRRRQVFSQAAFMWQTLRNGRPGDLKSDEQLDLLKRPWPGGTTGELLGIMEIDASLAGNCYLTTVDDRRRVGAASRGGPGRRIVRMRPDWVTLLVDSPDGDPFSIFAQIVGLQYQPPNMGRQIGLSEPMILLPRDFVHYSPKPDPEARYRGMSWLTPVIKEIQSDKAAQSHKRSFFENGAVHSMVMKFPPGTTPDQLREYKAIYDLEYKGTDNAYKVFFVAGADPIPASSDFRALDFKAIQGAGETRMAVAAGVPAAIAGISEGLEGSTLNAGNFQAARRLFVDTTQRDLWSIAASSLETLFDLPGPDRRLWYDDRDIPFLREDAQDDADIRAKDAQTLKTLVEGGFDPSSAVRYVTTGDLSLLSHTGKVSVQLQEPGAREQPPAAAATNGRANEIEAVARR